MCLQEGQQIDQIQTLRKGLGFQRLALVVANQDIWGFKVTHISQSINQPYRLDKAEAKPSGLKRLGRPKSQGKVCAMT